MFGWGKRREPEPSTPQQRWGGPKGDPGEPVIAAVLTDGTPFDLASLRQELGDTRVAGGRLTDFTLDNGVLACRWGDDVVGLVERPAPYPSKDLEGPCATSWMWPKGQSAAAAVQSHRHMVLVTMTGGKQPPVLRRLALTRVTAAVARRPGVVAVYWPEGTLVHYPPVFVQMAEKMTDPAAPPLYLWVDFRVWKNPDGTSGMFTTGLRPLGRMEVEIPTLPMKPGALREWGLNIAYYLLGDGVNVKDGDTMGVDAKTQIKIRHRPSSHGGAGTVLQFQT
jgi:hypothetical protein